MVYHCITIKVKAWAERAGCVADDCHYMGQPVHDIEPYKITIYLSIYLSK